MSRDPPRRWRSCWQAVWASDLGRYGANGRANGSAALIHPSAWKAHSPNLACRIPYTLGPLVPAEGPKRRSTTASGLYVLWCCMDTREANYGRRRKRDQAHRDAYHDPSGLGQQYYTNNYTNVARSYPHTSTRNHAQDIAYSLYLCEFLSPPRHNGKHPRASVAEYLSNGVSRVRIPPPSLSASPLPLRFSLSAFSDCREASRRRTKSAPRRGHLRTGEGRQEQGASCQQTSSQVEKVSGDDLVEQHVIHAQQEVVPAV
jgi:hypothetical protein